MPCRDGGIIWAYTAPEKGARQSWYKAAIFIIYLLVMILFFTHPSHATLLHRTEPTKQSQRKLKPRVLVEKLWKISTGKNKWILNVFSSSLSWMRRQQQRLREDCQPHDRNPLHVTGQTPESDNEGIKEGIGESTVDEAHFRSRHQFCVIIYNLQIFNGWYKR